MSIASELSTLVQNKSKIKSAIESRHPALQPSEDMSRWPASISSVYVNDVYGYERPSEWPDLESVLAAHPASARGYGYSYAMLVYGHYPPNPHTYIKVPKKGAGC